MTWYNQSLEVSKIKKNKKNFFEVFLIFFYFWNFKWLWYNKENCWTNKSFTCLPLRTDDHILEWSSALDTSITDNLKINNPTFDVANDVNQDFSLKYSNNKMGINGVINKLSIIVTVCVFVCHVFSHHPFYFDFHSARIIFDVSSGFYLWNVNRTSVKNVKVCFYRRKYHSLLFIFSLMIDSLILNNP